MAARSFSEEISANKRASVFYVFVVAIILIVLGGVIGAAFGNIVIGLAIAAAIATFQLLLVLTMGDTIALLAAGAKEVTHAQEPQLFNVVEEMSIASGLPMPKLYIIETQSLNAFATGLSPQRSAVAITRGLLQKLSRDELQGVMAHEMSHIRNYDIRVSIILAIMVGTIVLLADLFWRWAFWTGGRRSSSRDDNKAQMIIMLVAIVFAILAPIFAILLQYAVSRRREYLADASAAELTRYPQGLASALRKLSSSMNQPYKESGKAFSHLYIVNPHNPSLAINSAFSTHPPIHERIKRLEEMAYLYDDKRENSKKK